jgi:hypothetical protein
MIERDNEVFCLSPVVYNEVPSFLLLHHQLDSGRTYTVKIIIKTGNKWINTLLHGRGAFLPMI